VLRDVASPGIRASRGVYRTPSDPRLATGRLPLSSDDAMAAGPRDASSAALDRSLIGGMAWTAGVKWVSQLLTWPATLIAVRLLTPGDYGLVAMGSVYVTFVLLVNEFGLGSAVVQHRDLTEDQIAQINGLSLVFGIAGFLLSLILAYPLSVYYKTPAVQLVVIALSLNFFLTSLRTVPLALLTRDFQFRITAINEAVGAIAQSVSIVLFAWLGFRHWALVIGFLLASLATTVLAYIQRPQRVAYPRYRDIGGVVTWGGQVMGSRVAWYVYSFADSFVIGRVLGQAAVGTYSFGWSFASLPVEKVTSLVGRVAPPVLSAVQTDLAAFRRYVWQLSSGIAVLTLPAGIGLALVADDFVRVALGPQWTDAIEPLRVLGIFTIFRALLPIISQAATAVGLVKFAMRVSVASAVVMPLAFIAGAHWGTSGVALAWLIVYPIVSAPLFVVVLRRIEMPMRVYLGSLWPATSCTLVMIPAVLLPQFFLAAESIYVRLAAEVVAGAFAYAGTMWLFHRPQVRAAGAMVKAFRSSGA
jgi:O-antigen/teichoic acid export membrane protein